MPKLSVIICLYNTNKDYFKECLHSIFCYGNSDLEIIVVDDGSTLDYSDILDKFKNIKYVKTDNQGTLKARILGAELAESEYIAYMDSDDTVSPMYYDAMINVAKTTHADIILNDWAFHTKGAKYYCKRDVTIRKDLNVLGGEILDEFMKQEGLQHSYYVLWNKIFKKSVITKALRRIKNLNIERMIFAEDVLITFFACIYSKLLVNTHVGYYFYRIHESQETYVLGKEKLKRHITSQSYVFDVMEETLKSKGVFEKYYTNLYNWKKLLAYGHYATAKRHKYFELVPLIKECYRLSKLKMHFKKDSFYYDSQKVLPLNISELDDFLLKCLKLPNGSSISIKKGYVSKQLNSFNKVFQKDFVFKNTAHADAVAPKEYYSFKQQLIHNVLVFRIGMILFPKGSKIRKKLKFYF